MRANFLLFVRVLMALDFPAFDRPAKATSFPVSSGACLIEGALSKNSALLNKRLLGIGDLQVS